jgi:general secretion pathway protein I
MNRLRGFTLIEVLVALAVIGIAMAAAVRATVAVTDESITLRRHLAGGWVAQNRINGYTVRNDFPSVGLRTGVANEAGLDFEWKETVSDTPNAAFRRVEVRVTAPNSDHADAILIGYITNVAH